MHKKKESPRPGRVGRGPSNTPHHRQASGTTARKPNKSATEVKATPSPLQLPEYASLAPLASRLIPVCKPNGVPGKCTCPHHKHEPSSSGKAPIEKDWQKPGHKARWPRYEYNVGVRLGSTLAVLDVDPRNGGTDTLRELEERYGRVPETPRVATGGGGWHYYLLAPANQASWKLPSGLELKAQGSQVVAPGSLHSSGERYRWDVGTDVDLAELPEWLHTKPETATRPKLSVVPEQDPRPEVWVGNFLKWKGEQFKQAELVNRARLYVRGMPPAISGKGGHEVTFRVACALVRGFLLKGQDALTLLLEWNEHRAQPKWTRGELLHKLTDAVQARSFQWGYLLRGERDKYAPDEDEKLGDSHVEGDEESDLSTQGESEEGEEAAEAGTRKGRQDPRLVFVTSLNKFFFFAEGVGGKPRARDKGLQPLEVQAAVATLQAAGESFKTAARVVQKKQCVIVEDIMRWPSNERILTSKHGEKHLNPFWQLIPEPLKGTCTNLDALMLAIGGDKEGENWLWHWAAYVVQNPNIQPGVCVVARGDPGVGKSKLGEAIGLCRGVYTSVTNSAFHGEFNSRWADARFINAAEVMLADSRLEDNQKFLSLITDPEIEFHRKNQPAYEIPNRIAWWLTSNLDNPVKVPRGDRRFTVLDAGAPPAVNMAALVKGWAEYERRYHEWPELRAFKWKLLNWKVDERIARKPLINEAHLEVQEASRPSQEAFMDELKDNGLAVMSDRYGLQGVTGDEGVWKKDCVAVDPQFLYRLYQSWCKDMGLGPLGFIRFVNCRAIKQFPKIPQRRIKGILYRLRIVPK